MFNKKDISRGFNWTIGNFLARCFVRLIPIFFVVLLLIINFVYAYFQH